MSELTEYLAHKYNKMSKESKSETGLTYNPAYLGGYRQCVVDAQEYKPTLNENQQIVLEWLKENKMDNLFLTTARLHRGFLSGGVTSQVKSACGVLDLQQQAQVLQEFGKWVEEQEGDNEKDKSRH